MQKRTLSDNELGTLIFLAALIFGIWFRISAPLNAGFPINDGGLFYINILSIQNNHYQLPEFVQYNGMSIPFAYPPFAFYAAGWITDLFHLKLISTVLWLPAFVLILSIPAIYILAGFLLNSKLQAGIATFLYALLPRSLTWMIMGGGITRSLGQLFFILAIIQIYLLYSRKQKRFIPSSILFSALVCITHPEAAIHTITAAGILWVQFGRNRTGVKHSILIALGTLIVTSPWWLTILLRFGTAPFQSAAQTSFHSISNLLLPFTLFSEERFLPLIAPFAILGIGYMIAKREYLLPALYFVPLYIEPRFAFNISIIPMAFLASVALCELILPGVSTIEGKLRNIELTHPLQSRSGQFLLGVLVLNLLFGMQLAVTEYSKSRVPPSVRQASEWIRSHTPAEDKFLVMTGVEGVLDDPVNEWFPVLTERQSITTAQGAEWLGNNIFIKKLPLLREIQRCKTNISPLQCADTLANTMDIEYDYIMYVFSDQQDRSNTALDVYEFSEFQVVYSSSDVLVLMRISSDTNPN